MNNLSLSETERYGKLVEELGESLQALGKILSYGIYPTDCNNVSYDNKADLERELGDVLTNIRMMVNAKDIDINIIREFAEKKSKTIHNYLNHQLSNILDSSNFIKVCTTPLFDIEDTIFNIDTGIKYIVVKSPIYSMIKTDFGWEPAYGYIRASDINSPIYYQSQVVMERKFKK